MGSVHVLGIRHHGPGCARSVVQALTTLQPDVLLVEGPPDAASVLELIAHPQMRPPVALLTYAPDHPQYAAYYPFAVFSPEWQALRYGLAQQIPVRFMDLPQTHRFALLDPETHPDPASDGGSSASDTSNLTSDVALNSTAELESVPDQEVDSSSCADSQPILSVAATMPYRRDPLSLLAQAAGYDDGERWWEHLVEQRQDSTALFAAILEAMTVLRTEVEHPEPQLPIDAYREAYMRKTIREAQKQGFECIAVVCGAWHAPALTALPSAKADQALLKGLPKIKVETTWVPWTYGHLLWKSGYGAGIESPGWYHHLWEQGERQRRSRSEQGQTATVMTSIYWLTKVARLLRRKDLDVSSANVIEAVRLAEALAALRNFSLPGLAELNESTQTVLCFGDALPMQLIQEQLIVGERLGKIPTETPMVPLQQDLLRQQKTLRLKPDATETSLDLDLRKPLDLLRSQLLHRLNLLQVRWGKLRHAGNTKGTFREAWQLQWQPEFVLKLIEAGVWGNTIEAATTAQTCEAANQANLPQLTELIDHSLLAKLPTAISYLLERLQTEAAIASDCSHLMRALPPLVNISRYGSVRQFDPAIVLPVVDGLVTRICIGLPLALASLDDDAAQQFYDQIMHVHGAIGLLQNANHTEAWQTVLAQLVDQQGLHGLLAGRCCRLLFEAGRLGAEAAAQRLSLALSVASEPTQSAAWIEGFLAGSGLLLLHNPTLWQVIDTWVAQLQADNFTAILPLLRRTFSTFPAPERRQMGERVRQGQASAGLQKSQPGLFDCDRADTVLPLITQLLGLEFTPKSPALLSEEIN